MVNTLGCCIYLHRVEPLLRAALADGWMFE
jgi:hypothetical protein